MLGRAVQSVFAIDLFILNQEDKGMKHLLNSVAIAAVLAIATPTLAQNAPMTPSAPKPAAAAPAKAMPQKHHAMRHHTMRHHGRMMAKSGDRMTEQLNQQELQRLQGGAPAAAPPPMQGPRPSGMH